MATVLLGHFITMAYAYAWSPWNLLFGPQYKAKSQSRDQTEYEQKLNGFISRDLPKRYPALLAFLGVDNAIRIPYETHFGEIHFIEISNNKNDGVVIRTTIELTSSKDKRENITVFLIDRDRDSKLDSYGTDIFQPDGVDGDAWQALWHTFLAVAIENSGCCNE